MILLKKTNISDAPWKILFLSLFLSLIGLIALNSISYQNDSIIHNPFYKQLFFLLISWNCSVERLVMTASVLVWLQEWVL